jgi:hypothetical protein
MFPRALCTEHMIKISYATAANDTPYCKLHLYFKELCTYNIDDLEDINALIKKYPNGFLA